jgi:hypothetical protein
LKTSPKGGKAQLFAAPSAKPLNSALIPILTILGKSSAKLSG